MASSNLTVGDLIAMKQLACEVLAGSRGLGRPIVWAHSCELDDPWNWVSTDELLMTTGICIPSDSQLQEQLIAELHSAGLAGIAIGDDLQAPPILPAMLARADELGFPVISVAHATPFSAIGRTVAVAAQSEQITRIARLSRLYDAARSEAPLLTTLSSELGHVLHVVDVDFATEALAGVTALERDTMFAVCARAAEHAPRLPVRTAISSNGRLLATAFALPTHRRCMLVAEGPAEVDLDAFVLLHAQSLVGIELERATRDRERTDRMESDLFDEIVRGSIGTDAARPRLDHMGLTRTEWVVLGFDSTHVMACRILLGDRGIAKLVGQVGEEGYAVVSQDDLESATALLADAVPAMGTSASTSSVQRLPDSVRQARWALQAARANGGGVSEYSTAVPLFLPRTVSEAQFATREILGSLIDHDSANNSQLVDTLEAFLVLDRSWAATSTKLVIHRQTLAYRLKKIEDITGRSTKNSADIATLWLALISRRIGVNQYAE